MHRPRAGETDDDLLRQQAELSSRGGLRPSVKLVRSDKRKTQDGGVAGVCV